MYLNKKIILLVQSTGEMDIEVVTVQTLLCSSGTFSNL